MHVWLMENQKSFSDQTLMNAARSLGLDPGQLIAKMDSPEVAAALQEDIMAGRRTGLRGIPHLIVGGKKVPRWRLEGARVPEMIMQEVGGG